MKSRFVWILIILTVFVVSFWFMMDEEVVEPAEGYGEIATNWVLEKSPTYVFDGENLVLKDERVNEAGYLYTFTFESRHGGYGDRTNQIVTQAFMSHRMEVVVQGGEVISAVTDNIFDEINEVILE